MPARFVTIDRDTPMLLPASLQDWLPEDSPARLVVDLVEHLDFSEAQVNHSGSGSKQYPPSMMLALLLFSYSHGVFSSRRIEESTYTHIGVRYITGDHHPDHDSICKFRRENKKLIKSTFGQSLQIAGEAGILEIGKLTVSCDGTKLKADVNAHETPSIETIDAELGKIASEQKIVQKVVDDLLEQAERTDTEEENTSSPIPDELLDPSVRADKLAQALKLLRRKEKRAARLEAAKAMFAENKAKRSEEREQLIEEVKASGIGTIPRKCSGKVDAAKDKVNPADPDATKMKSRDGFIQGYNGQAAVDSGTSPEDPGSGLIVSAHITREAVDRHQLTSNAEELEATLGKNAVDTMVMDAGYDNTHQVDKIESNGGPTVLAEQQKRKSGTKKDDDEDDDGTGPGTKAGSEVRGQKKRTKQKRDGYYERLRRDENRSKRRRRKESVEPTFGVIKEQMGFRRFSLRGYEKVDLEWRLIGFAFNLRKLAKNVKWLARLKQRAA